MLTVFKENTRSQLESDIEKIKSTSSTSQTEFNSLKARISSLEESNRDTLGLLESKSSAYDKLAEDLSSQHRKTIDLRREVADLEQKLQAANSASASTRFHEQSLQQEVDLLKKNNEWFETELKTKSSEYLKFRKEKSARISELQRANEESNSRVGTLERSENALKSRLDEVEQKYEDSLATLQHLREESIQATESFRIELDSAGRLAQLQQTAAETAKQRVQECQLALEKSKDDAAGEISRLRAEAETEHSDKEAAERRIAELELTIKQLESSMGSRSQIMSPGQPMNNGSSTPLRPGTPVGAFSPRSSRTKGGLTLTQMYSEYDKMRTLLASEQKNNQELKVAMDEMVQDLESSKPEIDELRADHSRLEAAVVEMSNILDAAGKERDDATREARKWQGQVEGLEREGQILRQQLRDLSSQIKVLVMEVHLLNSGEKDYDREDLEKAAREGIEESTEDLNSTGRFISRHMTTFKNLNELQQQNVTLRRMLRDLGDKMEGEEARRKDLSYQKDQEELKELRVRVQTYRDEMANLVAQTKSYIKERDTFRSMLTRRRDNGESTEPFSQSLPLGAVPPAMDASISQPPQGPDYADLLRNLQTHFDSFRQETATDHSSLKQQVNDLSRKNSELQSEVSRSNSQLTASIQRAELLHSNINLLKDQNVELQKRHTTLMDNANKQDLRTQQVAEELVEAKALADSLRRETTNLKAEKDLWKNIEKRLVEDNESLRNERSRLDSLNASLQSMLNEREHSEAENRRRLQATVESLESELQTTKRKLNDETEDAKKSTLRREYEHEQSQKRIDDLVTSLGSAREELIATKTSRDHLQSRVDELSVELKSAEERLTVLQRKPSTTTAPTEPTTGTTIPEGAEEGELSREQELAVEVSELKRDLELANGELEHSKEQVEDYKAISQSTEERLQSLNETNDQYREDTDRLLEEKNAKIVDLEKRIEEITSELSTTNTELSNLRNEEGEFQRRFDDQKSMLESEITRLKEQEERYTAAAQFHQQDLKAQADIAQQAQQNYENELVKHAEAAKTLQTVRADSNQLKLEVVDLRTQAESAKNDLARQEENWGEMKERYETEISELTRRREEVLNQNSLLHTQLENITKQIATLQRDRTNAGEDEGESSASGTDLEGLQEVIKYLRREKEIVDVQYHLSTQESKRLRQQLAYTQSQLEDTRLKLEQQRRAEADSEHNALNHNKLVETLNELNLFRESSVTLRNQVKQAEASIAAKSTQIDELQQQIEPFQTRIRELEDVVETKDGELKLLQEDRDRWQQRTQNILQKYDRVDPAEMETLKEKLSSLEKERDEANSSKDALQAQIDKAEERVHNLRITLTDQFKARSKELTGRINAKQGELNTAVQEKEAIRVELERTKEELNSIKLKATENAAIPATTGQDAVEPKPAGAAEGTPETDSASAEKIKELEAKVKSLEAALAEKEAEADGKVKERVDKMKQILNAKLAESKTLHKQEIDKLKESYQQAPPSKGEGPLEFTDAQARKLVEENETILSIVRSNIRGKVASARETASKEKLAALEELEKKCNEEKEALVKERDLKISQAEELAEKRVKVKLSMTESRIKQAQNKLDLVHRAAADTPQKAVVEVWDLIKAVRANATPAKPAPPPGTAAVPQSPAPQPQPPQQDQQGKSQQPATPVKPVATPQPQPAQPAQQPVQQQPTGEQPQGTPSAKQQQAPPTTTPATTPALTPAPTPTPAPTQTPSQTPVETPVQAPVPAPVQPSTHPQPSPQPPAQPPAQQPSQNQSAAGLPNRPPQATHHTGTGPGALRALQSGLPMARGGGRGRGGPHNQYNQQAAEQQQQTSSGRGSGFQRGGRGRGGQGRGGAQSVQTGNVAGGQGQPSPRGGRGGLNVQARQFIPQGNKRTREDGGEADTGSGKRIRGGGGGGRGG